MNHTTKTGKILENKELDVITYTSDGALLLKTPKKIYKRKLHQDSKTKRVYVVHNKEKLYLPPAENADVQSKIETDKAPQSIKEGLDKVQAFDGQDYTEERYKELESILDTLPCYPMKDEFGYVTVLHVEEGWFTRIAIDIKDNEKICIYMDGDNLDPSKTRVKTTDEVLALAKEYKEIKDANDIDPFWQMTEDHKYFSKMSEEDDKAKRRRREILLMLQ